MGEGPLSELMVRVAAANPEHMLHAIEVQDTYFPPRIVKEALAMYARGGRFEWHVERIWRAHYSGEEVTVTIERGAFVCACDLRDVQRVGGFHPTDLAVAQRALVAHVIADGEDS